MKTNFKLYSQIKILGILGLNTKKVVIMFKVLFSLFHMIKLSNNNKFLKFQQIIL